MVLLIAVYLRSSLLLLHAVLYYFIRFLIYARDLLVNAKVLFDEKMSAVTLEIFDTE